MVLCKYVLGVYIVISNEQYRKHNYSVYKISRRKVVYNTLALFALLLSPAKRKTYYI